MILHGENIKIYSGGHVIALATSCTIETTAATNETASTSKARQKNWLEGRTDWKMSIARFVDNMQSQMIMAGNEYVITIWVSNSDMLTGKALCAESRSDYSVGKLAQGFCQFIGNGALQ